MPAAYARPTVGYSKVVFKKYSTFVWVLDSGFRNVIFKMG